MDTEGGSMNSEKSHEQWDIFMTRFQQLGKDRWTLRDDL
jgi:hypothetical protein